MAEFTDDEIFEEEYGDAARALARAIVAFDRAKTELAECKAAMTIMSDKLVRRERGDAYEP